jgi:hypothetical protein
VTPANLLAFGACDNGELYVHRHDGSVHIWSQLDGPAKRLVLLAPDLDVFTRILEAVYCYSSACWHPYPVEEDQEAVAPVFLEEMDERGPGPVRRGDARRHGVEVGCTQASPSWGWIASRAAPEVSALWVTFS